MPSGTGVVDAFKSTSPILFSPPVHRSRNLPDLIRHGKNHSSRQQDDPNYPSSGTPTPTHSHHKQPKESRDSRAAEPQKQHRDHQQQSQTPKYKEEVEKIVQEERAAKNKMPNYKGLEQFKLIDKMGEYVIASSPTYADRPLIPLFTAVPSQMCTRPSIFALAKRLQVRSAL